MSAASGLSTSRLPLVRKTLRHWQNFAVASVFVFSCEHRRHPVPGVIYAALSRHGRITAWLVVEGRRYGKLEQRRRDSVPVGPAPRLCLTRDDATLGPKFQDQPGLRAKKHAVLFSWCRVPVSPVRSI
jgi:hypothetical protein